MNYFIGIASGHLVKRSTMVNKYVNTLEGGSGPTKSTWIWSNLRVVGSKFCSGATVCLPIFAFWEDMHSLVHLPTSIAKTCHTKLAVNSFFDALLPGWDELTHGLPWGCVINKMITESGGTYLKIWSFLDNFVISIIFFREDLQNDDYNCRCHDRK